MCLLKTWKKFGKPRNFFKTSGNPEILKILKNSEIQLVKIGANIRFLMEGANYNIKKRPFH